MCRPRNSWRNGREKVVSEKNIDIATCYSKCEKLGVIDVSTKHKGNANAKERNHNQYQ